MALLEKELREAEGELQKAQVAEDEAMDARPEGSRVQTARRPNADD